MSRVVVLKAVINGVRPAVWRRLEVPTDWSLEDLHHCLQAAFGWTDTHLHHFEIGGLYYAPPDPDTFQDGEDSRCFPLAGFEGLVDRMTYTYDFGDDWRHAIRFEAWKDAEPGQRYPRCTAGRRERPPEDCGGPWGYEELQAIVKDPRHPEHAERMEWLGGPLLEEAFDLAQVNAALAALKPPKTAAMGKAKSGGVRRGRGN